MTTIDADEIEAVTIDGVEVEEITMDGDVVWRGIIIEETFEDGTATNWTLGSGWNVSTDVAHNGAYSLHSPKDAGSSYLDSGFDKGQEIDDLWVWLYLDEPDYRPIVRVRNSDPEPWLRWEVEMDNNDDPEILFNGGSSSYRTGTVSENTWIRVGMENIDQSTETYDGVVYDNTGSELFRSNDLTFMDTTVSPTLNDIYIIDSRNLSSFYIDDIIVK